MASILPKKIEEFGSSDYWNNFFTKRSTTFEWYGDFSTLVEILVQNIKKSDSVLEVGCGNSVLSADIYDKVGCATYLGIDYSKKAIEQSKKLITPSRSSLRFEVADVFNLNSELDRLGLMNNHFNCVVDKGTFDAIDNGQTEVNVNHYFDEIASALALFGRYILITLAQDHVVKHIVDYFLDKDSQWIVSCYQVTNPEERPTDHISLPLFTFVMTKMKPAPVLPQLRLKALSDDQPCRPIQEGLKQRLVDWIKYLQISCILSQSRIKSKRDREFEIVHAKSGLAMFVCRLVVADKARDSTSCEKYHPKAVFLVPQADAEDYVPAEAAQRLLESMGRITCALLAFPHPALRFASLKVAKSSLSDGLVVSPLAATVRNLPIYSTTDGYSKMHVVKEVGTYAVITEAAKKRRLQNRILVQCLDADIYRFISDEAFSEPSSILLLAWINVTRRLADTLGQGGAKLVYYGVPPCFHKAVMESLHDESDEGYAFMCYDPIDDQSEESLPDFLQAAEKYLISQGICCVLSRSTAVNNTLPHDRISQIEQICGPSLKVLLKQECGAAGIYVIFKKKHKVPKAKLAARLSHIALGASAMEGSISSNNKLHNMSNDVLEKLA
ncbi:eEF1A lysine and N-terminal methyltransferase [Taenia crassiceps]|uniref:EEF1A lysine and N-terminal methyltransferase n=1 Tax=Taenia crassiceps TaxID=6207 RepID=A0ABR4QGM2_9CEST